MRQEGGKGRKQKSQILASLTFGFRFVPRAAFEIIKVGKMWGKRKTQKNTAI